MEYDITSTTQTSMATVVKDFIVKLMTLDKSQDQKETIYDNSYFNQYLGYYKIIPEYKTAINAYATWVVGKGWTSDTSTKLMLENISGWGEDTFISIMWNMLVMKKIQGDAFAEIIRNDKGKLINIKPLGTLRIVTNKEGKILRYEDIETNIKFNPTEILHLCNDRIGNEIHGTPITQSIKWALDARNEAMEDKRREEHRSTVRIMEVEEDDTSRLSNLKRDYAEAINKGEVLLVPKGTGTIQDFAAPQSQKLEWIRYLENAYYQALGIPKVILGGSEEFTESSAKIGYLTYEQIYTKEIEELKADLWNQVAIKIEFVKPASLVNETLTGEKGNEQTSFQPQDTKVDAVAGGDK